MPLILAIEPDRQQASRVAALAGPLKAELIVAESTERAFATLAGRVPDLVLTSLLLSSKDEAALADRLRDLDAAGARVQTLVIPVLSAPRRSDGKNGIFDKLRRPPRRNSTPHGCDPAVFAEQIAEYLKGAAAERDLAEEGRNGDDETSAFDRALDPSSVPGAASAGGRTIDDDLTVDDVAAEKNGPPPANQSGVESAAFGAGVPDDFDIAAAEAASASSSESGSSYADASPAWAEAAGPVIEPLQSETPDLDRMAPAEARSTLDDDIAAFLEALPKLEIRAEPAAHAQAAIAVTPDNEPAASRGVSAEHPGQKDKRAEEVQNDWSFFDPARCGFAALLAKLDDLAAEDQRPA